ncbi:hypothetical protein ABCS64_07100 [Rhodocyclaceae bacterium Wk13]|uniref:Uncharacterized protein n=1 Tax=Dentiradicibacter hellwigii TaxID=3149053 RepID=A0ABV4UGR5_9RHOO
MDFRVRKYPQVAPAIHNIPLNAKKMTTRIVMPRIPEKSTALPRASQTKFSMPAKIAARKAIDVPIRIFLRGVKYAVTNAAKAGAPHKKNARTSVN